MRQNGMMLDYLEGSAEEDMKKWDAVREKRAAVRREREQRELEQKKMREEEEARLQAVAAQAEA